MAINLRSSNSQHIEWYKIFNVKKCETLFKDWNKSHLKVILVHCALYCFFQIHYFIFVVKYNEFKMK